MAVFYSLAVLTAIEIGVVYLPTTKMLIAILLVGLALSKAVLVAMYFMHLKFEKRTLGIIALTPLVLCTLLIIALLPDLTGTPHKTIAKAVVEEQSEANHSAE
jgi:cytochrome c oxidase subunit 4